eukprot:CAMPEP_0182446532 /NCGR_PEP_ID=MMETSP1172-20130603/4266_1 /TAXON_ID=708627 /ORGANISM="Timspurckia oligopyrenoides, Strain CCMP3278" /LENGTH=292 /DNA_ID=CAMNT_0024642481 /DNA_START=56 /DNA_END=934 /DNA_ORIENTATION=-
MDGGRFGMFPEPLPSIRQLETSYDLNGTGGDRRQVENNFRLEQHNRILQGLNNERESETGEMDTLSEHVRPNRMSLNFILNEEPQEVDVPHQDDGEPSSKTSARESQGARESYGNERSEGVQISEGERERDEERDLLLSAAMDLRESVRARRFWTQEEDERLERLVGKYGKGKWRKVAKEFEDRTPAQVRSRWVHFVSDRESNRPFTREEDEFILKQYGKIGSKWNLIASQMTHRVGNTVKNRFRLLERHKNRILKQRAGGTSKNLKMNVGLQQERAIKEGSTIRDKDSGSG